MAIPVSADIAELLESENKAAALAAMGALPASQLPAVASDGEITAGTSTSPRLVTPAQLKLVAETHAPGGTGPSSAVLFVEQALTDEQQELARTNIGATHMVDAPPSNDFGADGDTAIVIGSGVIYTKAAGAWGVSAAPVNVKCHAVNSSGSLIAGLGSTGDVALLYDSVTSTLQALYEKTNSTTWTLRARANKCHAVTSEPTSGVGVQGDLAILYEGVTATAIYEKTNATTWVLRGSFAGTGGSAVSVGTADPTGGDDGDVVIQYDANGFVSTLWKKVSATWTSLGEFQPKARAPRFSLFDDFFGGTNVSGSLGELGWVFTSKASGGGGRPSSITHNTASGVFGVAEVFTDGTAGNWTQLHISTNTAGSAGGYTITNLHALAPEITFRFKLGASTDCVLGVAIPQIAGATTFPPSRMIGMRAATTDSFFQFVAVSGGVGTPVPSDIAVDQNWHTFRMRWDVAAGNWKMRIDNEVEKSVADSNLGASDSLTFSAIVNNLDAVSRFLYLDYFSITGTR